MGIFLRNIEIRNFKKFGQLTVENLGQINLITGDNNVGKTTFLESLLFSENNLEWIGFIHAVLCSKGIHFHIKNKHTKDISFPDESFLDYILNDVSKEYEIKYNNGEESKTISLQYLNIEKLTDEIKLLRRDKYDVNNIKNWVLFKKNGQNDELQWLNFDDYDISFHGYWPYISFNVSYNEDLNNFVIELEEKVKKLNSELDRKIIELMKLFINDLENYKIIRIGNKNLIGFATKSNKQYVPITQFGDGVQKYFRYIVEILYAKEKGFNRIMIDEIDTGVHYLKLTKMWESIIALAIENNIQIFATTHSLECIQSLLEAGELSTIKHEIKIIELDQFTTKSGHLKQTATTYDFENSKFRLETENNVRGGDVWA